MNKRLQLLIAAKKMFAHQGIDKTSIREIATEANVNSSMISYYFKSKDGLLEGIFEEFFPKNTELSTDISPVERLKKIIKAIITLRKNDSDLIDILHSEMILKSSRLESIKSYTQPFWSEIYHLLDLSKEEGLLNFESTDLAYMYVMATISFPYHNPMFSPVTKQRDIDVDALIEMIMKGLR